MRMLSVLCSHCITGGFFRPSNQPVVHQLSIHDHQGLQLLVKPAQVQSGGIHPVLGMYKVQRLDRTNATVAFSTFQTLTCRGPEGQCKLVS